MLNGTSSRSVYPSLSPLSSCRQGQDAGLPSDPSLPDGLSAWGSQDVAIAAFLMLLWREMYPSQKVDAEDREKRDWEDWGRPVGGFIDLGCVRQSFTATWK